MRYKDPRPEVLSAFHSAIEAEDIEAVDELLKEDIDINSCNGYEETALHRACARRNLPLVMKLLEAKANPQSKNKYGETALMSLLASDGVSTDDLAIVKKLLETDPDVVLHADCTGDMPLHAAARSDRTEIMKLLLKAGANPDVQNSLGETALHQCYSVQTARVLVNAGAKVELANFRGESALDRAVAYGSVMEDMAILLLENASSSTVQATGSFLLYTTVSGGDTNKVSKLLTKGVNLNFRYPHGATPLHQAALSSTPAMLDLLLQNKADITAKVTDGSTPLHYAALSGDFQKVKLLLDAGSSLMASDKHGKTALHYAALLRYPRIVNALLEAGAMQDAEDKRGRTPLHCVVRYTFQEVKTLFAGIGTARTYVYDIRQNWKAATLEVVKILLNAKATVATNTKRGRRLRGFAAAIAEVSGLLVVAKASVTIRDKLGKTALHYAAENSPAEIVKLLLDAGASATIGDKRRATPLHYASAYGTPDVVKLLLDANADIEARCNLSATPLLWSAMNRTNCETVTFLLEVGADITARDIDGLTALDRATEREYAGIVNIFQGYLGLRRECILCCELWLTTDFSSDHVGKHVVCMFCFAKYLRAKVLEQGTTMILCPGEDCDMPLSYEDIKQISDEETFSRFDKLLLNKMLEADERFRWCANQNCSAGQFVENRRYMSFFTCAECKAKSCFDCRGLAHQGFTCDQYKAFRIAEETPADSATTAWIDTNARRCPPPCNTPIERVSGCKHMTCKMCKAEWCWYCGARYQKDIVTDHKEDCRRKY